MTRSGNKLIDRGDAIRERPLGKLFFRFATREQDIRQPITISGFLASSFRKSTPLSQIAGSTFLPRQGRSSRFGYAPLCSPQSRSLSARDQRCLRGSEAKRLVKTASASASSRRPCSASQHHRRRYYYCSIIDNFGQNDSQISCSNMSKLAHSYNYVQRDTVLWTRAGVKIASTPQRPPDLLRRLES